MNISNTNELKLLDKDNKTNEVVKPPPVVDLQVWERPDFYYICLFGFILAMLAGCINCIVLIKYAVTPSHQTGTTTKLGINFQN